MRRGRFIAAVLAFAAGISTGSAQPDGPKAYPENIDSALTAYTNSGSTVLGLTHILLIEVTTANAGPWDLSRSGEGFETRSVDVSVQVVEILRGTLDPAPAGPVHISITQYDYDSELMWQPLPGPWPPGELLPGTALVVFAQTDE